MGITIAVLFLPSTFFSVVWITLHWYVIVGGIAGMILLDDEYEDWIDAFRAAPERRQPWPANPMLPTLATKPELDMPPALGVRTY